MRTLTVELPGRAYPVLVGAGARHRLGEVLPSGAERAAIVTQENIPWAVDTGVEQKTFVMGDGEPEKNLETVEELCRGFARWGLHRHDVVVAVGGGVVTDVAGFAAAVYHRGIRVVHVPTSLLGQVDAAIGGKTGVNLPEGKNLVGAFWQPEAVLCDTETLATLAPREYRSGLGEMAKYAFLGVDGLRDLALDDAVAACVACKAAIVSGDEREAGSRALLNYGHTLAHALETAGSYDLRHGEAVAIGLVFAARLAECLGRIRPERVAEHRDLVSSYDLPVEIPPGVAAAELVTIMSRDKKASGDDLTFVLDGSRGLEVVRNIPAATVTEVLEATLR
ncbi:MAG: 3-dehydroquinate synthase [Acidobacteriota bacterium]|nr:3-dehydroquinate synthase [Acidobacteriota bacterium]